MLAFYAWTDTLILNMCNTKLAYFPSESSALFILNMPRISPELIKTVQEFNVFENVYIIKPPPFELAKGSPLTLKEKIAKLFSGRRMKQHYFNELRNHVGSTRYTKLFTGAFWANTLFIYWYFSKFHKDIDIELVEEGLANYNSSKDWEFKCLPTHKKTELLMRYMYFLPIWKKAKRHTSRKYLYHPSFTRLNCRLEVLPLPPIKPGEVCHSILAKSGSHIDMQEYISRKLYYILGFDPYGKYPRQFSDVVKTLLSTVPKGEILVKMHPSMINLPLEMPSEVYIDRRRYFFESACLQLDLSRKVIIVLNSTLPVMMKNLLCSEPIVIFTHKLFPIKQKAKMDEYNTLALDLKSIYENPGKIYIPGTLDELEATLSLI